MAPLARVCVCSCGAEVLHVPPELAPAVDQYVEPVPRWACPRRSGVLTWLVLLSIPSASFLFLIGPHLAARDGVHLVAAVALTYLVSTTFMALAAFSDPGTIPPNRDPDVRRAVQQRSPVEVTVRGTRLTLKHCATCGIHRPPRSAHCPGGRRLLRAAAASRWDHYCPWIGNSVGRRNYPFFLLFVASTLAHSLLTAVASVLHLTEVAASLAASADDAAAASAVVVAAAASPGPVALLAYCALASGLLGLLLAYHVFLVSTNQTTYENVRAEWAFKPNPFDSG
ncbi:hypothetical protein EMIHUDRAFT_69315, partial [Emiliania huxleyi CCMP1516]|uniref:Palmitoyltransferase n=2 Tax=Emiliania huxleyi TaxID=2903 RepID=A0A0D3HY33_EMIH1